MLRMASGLSSGTGSALPKMRPPRALLNCSIVRAVTAIFEADQARLIRGWEAKDSV